MLAGKLRLLSGKVSHGESDRLAKSVDEEEKVPQMSEWQEPKRQRCIFSEALSMMNSKLNGKRKDDGPGQGG